MTETEKKLREWRWTCKAILEEMLEFIDAEDLDARLLGTDDEERREGYIAGLGFARELVNGYVRMAQKIDTWPALTVPED